MGAWVAVAVGGGEDKVIGCVPLPAPAHLLQEVFLAPGLEGGDDFWGKVYDPISGNRLGRQQLIVAYVVVWRVEGLGNADGAVLHIKIMPGESQQLTNPHAGIGKKHEKGIVTGKAVLAGGGQELVKLLLLQIGWHLLDLLYAPGLPSWGAGKAGRVLTYNPVLAGPLEHHAGGGVRSGNGIGGKAAFGKSVQSPLINPRIYGLHGYFAQDFTHEGNLVLADPHGALLHIYGIAFQPFCGKVLKGDAADRDKAFGANRHLFLCCSQLGLAFGLEPATLYFHRFAGFGVHPAFYAVVPKFSTFTKRSHRYTSCVDHRPPKVVYYDLGVQ